MAAINAGVVVVSKFVVSSAKEFSAYINYIDRDSATRNDNTEKYTLDELSPAIAEYNKYLGYMDNPNKTTDLFTADTDQLSDEQKEALKSIFKAAQKNDSLMWQTVISFDNKWLKENGLYDEETNTVDEVKLKECTRGCMNKILEKENLIDSGIWSAAIHYNTDNIHIHIATVEPLPMREKVKKIYVTIDNRWLEKNNVELPPFPINTMERAFGEKTADKTREYYKKVESALNVKGIALKMGNYIGCDGNGNLVLSTKTYGTLPKEFKIDVKEEYKGNFKQSSIYAGKSFVVNNIISQQMENTQINDIMRKSIIGSAKQNPVMQDKEIAKMFVKLHKQMPLDRRAWKYNTTLMSSLQPQIDQITTLYIEKYHKEEFEELKRLLRQQDEKYKTAYGKSSHYADNKINDFYSRMGNTILSEMKSYDNNLRREQKERFQRAKEKTINKNESRYISHTITNSMRKLKRQLDRTFEHTKNQQIFEQLQEEIENEK